MSYARWMGCVVVSLLLAPQVASAQLKPELAREPSTKAVEIGLTAGVITPGVIHCDQCNTSRLDLNTSFVGGLFLDVRLVQGLSMGLFWDVANVSWEGESALLLNSGAALKTSFPLGPMSVGPGIAVGYGRAGATAEVDASNYLTLKAGIQAVVGSVVFDVAAFGSPWGGNWASVVTFGPVAQVRMGFRF